MSGGKECTIHKDRRQKAVQRCCGCLLILIFLILLTILITWAVIQPKKPRFILQDATIYNFNVSAPNIFSTTIQVTVSSHNPNRRVGVYYDKLDVIATYKNQQITYPTVIPPVYQGHKDTNLWSPFIYGNNVPIAPFNGPDLRQDQDAGAVWITVKLNGRVKWRVGSSISTSRVLLTYRLGTCPKTAESSLVTPSSISSPAAVTSVSSINGVKRRPSSISYYL